MNHQAHTHDILPTVRIRDKAVAGGSRLINREDLTDKHIIIEDDAAIDEQPEKSKEK